jgi:Flp pilus assembly protein TadB
VFRRRPPSEPADQPADKAGGKGRPTPKRREAERTRRQAARPPRDRREAARQARQRAREERTRARQGLASGDERNLPPRDQGPARRLARDYVDGRRTLAEFFLPVAILIFVSGLVPVPAVVIAGQLLFIAVIVLLVTDLFIVVRGLKRTVREQLPTADTRGLTFYAIMRALQIRRLRLPPPRVKPGATS